MRDLIVTNVSMLSIFINDRIGARDTMFILGFAFLSTMSYLYGVQLDDQCTDDRLPVHIILGANEYLILT